MSQRPEESLLSRVHRTVIMEGATGGLANGIDTMMEGAQGTDITGIAGANIESGSTLHHGPIDGGAALDRPSAGYLAHASASEGVVLEPATNGMSSIARDLNAAGTLTIDGREIEVLDYLPGGDMVQMAAGQVDPGQVLMKLAQHGIAERSGGGAGTEPQASGHGSTAGGSGGQDSIVEENGSREPGSADETLDQDGGEPEKRKAADGGRRREPDADENARDLEALAFEHHLDLDTAVQFSDTSRVHTQIHAHGRTLELTTDFEATKPDNAEEREEASEHVREVARGGHDELNVDEPNMHMRSRIAAHLDAASRDEGISR